MQTYLVERYLPEAAGLGPNDIAGRAEAAAAAMRLEGVPIRYLGSTLAPADESCLCVFEAPTEQAVRETNDRAGLAYERIVEAVLAPSPPPEGVEMVRADVPEPSRGEGER